MKIIIVKIDSTFGQMMKAVFEAVENAIEKKKKWCRRILVNNIFFLFLQWIF